MLYISQLARDRGIKVLLSGAGGDDLFSGYRRHLAVHYEHYRHWLPRRLPSGLAQAAARLEYPDEYFDRVYSWGVLHHSPDTPRALSEVWRVLKRGGGHGS